MQCFWCQKKVGGRERTRDHLLFKHLRSVYGDTFSDQYKAGRNAWVVNSCNGCNQQRNRISCVSWVVRCWQNGEIDKIPGCVPTLRQLIRSVDRTLRAVDISKLKSRLSEVPQPTREACLYEINLLVDFAQIYGENRVRTFDIYHCKDCNVKTGQRTMFLDGTDEIVLDSRAACFGPHRPYEVELKEAS